MVGDLPRDLAAAIPAQWPTELRTAVGLALAAGFPAVVWFGGPDTWHRVANEAGRHLLGDADLDIDETLNAVLRTAAASSTTLHPPTADGDDARHRTLRLSAGPVFAADGTVCAVFGTITDLDPAAASRDPTQLRKRLRRALDAATCEQDVAAAFLRCPEASLAADAVSLGVIDPEQGTLRIIFVGDIPAEQRDRYYAVAVDAPGPMAESVRTGRTVLVQNTAHGQEPHRSVLSDFADFLGTLVFNPLRNSAGACIGAVALGWSVQRPLSVAELGDLSVSIALAGPALARVQAAAEHRHIAAQLQDHLLDLDRSSLAAAVAAAHQPGADGSRFGAHWYLAAPGGTPDRIALCVGRVVGHGLPAAAVMSRLRGAVAVAAGATDDPRHVLDAVTRQARTLRGARGAAFAYGVLDRVHHTLDYMCVGNPPPLLVRPDGRIQYLTGDPAAAATAELPPGALLVLYTEGLVERPGAETTAGLARLAEAAAECATLPVGTVCTHLLDRLAGPDGFPDEVALLAVRPSGITQCSFVQVIAALPEQTVHVRDRLRAWLGPGCPEPFLGEALISVGEALSNALDHGSDPDLGHTISVESFLHDDGLSTTVSDAGRWTGDSSASRREAVRGRGLKMIHGLSRRVETVRGAHGTRMTMHHALVRDPEIAEATGGRAHRT